MHALQDKRGVKSARWFIGCRGRPSGLESHLARCCAQRHGSPFGLRITSSGTGEDPVPHSHVFVLRHMLPAAARGAERDSLPYLDWEYGHGDVKEYVHRMVQAEKLRGPGPPSPVARRPHPLYAASVALQQEMERVEAGEPLQGIDLTRYRIDAVPTTKDDVDRMYIALQYEQNRTQRLEMLKAYGADVWRDYCDGLDQIIAALQEEESKVRAAVDGINRKRKAVQMEAEPLLRQKEVKMQRQIEHNAKLLKELNAMRNHVH